MQEVKKDKKERPENPKIHVADLYLAKDKKGQTYIAGRWGNIYVAVYQNDNKQLETDPDYKFYISPVFLARSEEEKLDHFERMME